MQVRGQRVKDRFTVEPTGFSLIDPATTAGVQPSGLSGWTLDMSEEFNGSTVTVVDAPTGMVKFRSDGPQWATWYPDWPTFIAQDPAGVGGYGVHCNTNGDTYFDTSKVALNGSGQLVLSTAKNNPVPGVLEYTGGMIQSLGRNWTSSSPYTFANDVFIEARMQCPSNLAGIWPAGWTLSADFGGSFNGGAVSTHNDEIDYYEMFGDAWAYENNVYLPSTSFQQTVDLGSLANSQATHTYGMKWTAGSVTFYLDGSVVNTSSSVVPSHTSFLLFDLDAYKAHTPTYSSATLLIDYVRVWK